MVTPLLLAVLASLSADVVHLKQGRGEKKKPIEGRILDYDRFIEVEQPDGRRARVAKAEIERIDIAPRLIHSPDQQPFPMDLLEKQTEYEFTSFRSVLVALPKPPGRKVVAVDFLTSKKIWELDLPHRVGVPVLGGRTLFLFQREKFVDDAKKVKVSGNLVSKEVHRLTVKAVDLESGQTQWTQAFENNDRRDLLWEFTPAAPLLSIIPDAVVIRCIKTGYPVDKAGVVDKTQPRTYATFYTYDTAAKRLLHSSDSSEAIEMTSRAFFLDDLVVVQVYEGQARFRLLGVALRDGKLRWKSEELFGKLVDVVGENAYVAEQSHLNAYSARTGKKLDKWAVELTGGQVVDIDHNFVYYYRTQREPRGVFGYDIHKAEEAFRIEAAERDQANHLMLVGHRLLYTDRENAVHAYDTVFRKELWKWAGAGTGPLTHAAVIGSALTFYKDRRIYHVDLNTGEKLWEIRGDIVTLKPVGEVGALAKRFMSNDFVVIRDRVVPPTASFFTPTRTALRYALGEEAWSVPAFGKDAAYSISSSGFLLAFDLKAGKPRRLQRLSAAPVSLLSAPILLDGRLAVSVNHMTHVLDAEGDARHYQVQHTPFRPEQQAFLLDKAMLVAGGNLALVDFATGKKLWDTRAKPVSHFAGGDKVYLLAAREVQVLNPKTGEAEVGVPAPEGTTLVVGAGKRIYAAQGPYALHELAPGEEPKTRLKAGQQDPRVAQKFKGSLVPAGASVLYSHADGEVACLDAASDKTLWTFKAPDHTSPLLVHGERVWFSAGARGLFGLNVKTGVVEWKLPAEDGHAFTPFVHGNKVAFWNAEGWLVTTE